MPPVLGSRVHGLSDGTLSMSPPPIRLRVTPPIGEPFDHLCEADALTVGRSSKADLVLSDRFLSRLHARFYREGDAWVVEDLGSRNTTLLNGRPLATPARLSAGDLVKLSETVISIEGFDATSSRPSVDSIQEFRVVLSFAPVGEGGPVLPTGVSTRLAGRAMLLKKIAEVERPMLRRWTY